MTANARDNKRLPGAGKRNSCVVYEYVWGGEFWDTGDGACNAALRAMTPHIVGLGRSGYPPVLPPGKWVRDHSVFPTCCISFLAALAIASFRWRALRQETKTAKCYLVSRFHLTRWSHAHRPQWNTLGPIVNPYEHVPYVHGCPLGGPQKRFKGRGWTYRVRW